MRSNVTLANLTTTCSLVCAVVALMLAADAQLGAAMIAVAIAAVLDSIDGPLARRAKSGTGFGGELDSLADHVAFGVAPAMMLYTAVDGVAVVGPAACVAFVVAGAWRLARFSSAAYDGGRFVGLPLPPAGLLVAAAAALPLAPGLALALVAVLAVTMVSTVPFPTFLGLWRIARPAGEEVAVPRSGRDRRLHRRRPRQRVRRSRDDGQRHAEPGEDERVGAPALARE